METKTKIGIVGGGISGLTCAYELIREGFEVTVIEKDALIGGRINYAAAIASESFQTNIISLIKELGLDAVKIPLKKKETGFVLKDIVGSESLPLFTLKSSGVRGTFSFLTFSQFVGSLNFNAFSPDERLLKLRKISFGEFIKDHPKELKDFLIAMLRALSTVDDMEEISADYGLNLIRMGLEIISGKGIGFEDLNLTTICNVLIRKIEERGGRILTSSEVKRIIKNGNNGFVVDYRKINKEYRETFDQIVITTPLYTISEIFPELNPKTNIRYSKMKVLIIKGKLKGEKKALFGFPENPHNIRLFLALNSAEHYLFPWSEKEEVNFDLFYENWMIISEKNLSPVMPIIPPNPVIPELKTEIEGAYICGDFYYYPFDTPVQTAKQVAKMIIESAGS